MGLLGLLGFWPWSGGFLGLLYLGLEGLGLRGQGLYGLWGFWVVGFRGLGGLEPFLGLSISFRA